MLDEEGLVALVVGSHRGGGRRRGGGFHDAAVLVDRGDLLAPAAPYGPGPTRNLHQRPAPKTRDQRRFALLDRFVRVSLVPEPNLLVLLLVPSDVLGGRIYGLVSAP